MIGTILDVADGLIRLARRTVDPCLEAAAADSLARQALRSFARSGDRRAHRAYLRHRRAHRWWSARCEARSS